MHQVWIFNGYYNVNVTFILEKLKLGLQEQVCLIWENELVIVSDLVFSYFKLKKEIEKEKLCLQFLYQHKKEQANGHIERLKIT